jgi:GAF domain-containing protein
VATYEQDVTATLVELADTLVSDFDLLDYLDVLLERSSAALDAAAGGVMLTDHHGDLQVLASTDEQMRLMELYELQRQEGPCIDAHRRGEAVVEPDLDATARWPQFTAEARERGYRAAFAFPMRLRGEQIGALNLFRTEPGSIDAQLVRATRAFADMAAIGILQERAVREGHELARQLQGALNSRIVLEQAKGIVAERAGCELGEAYQLLRWYARNHNRALRVVAAAVVSGDLSASDLAPPGTSPPHVD